MRISDWSSDVCSSDLIAFPPTEADIRSLRAGEMIHIEGEIVMTAGLPTHQRLMQGIADGTPPPTDLTGAGFFHLGSNNTEADGKFDVLYMNPTTSTRFNTLVPPLIRASRLRPVGGTGGPARPCADAITAGGRVQ